MSYHWGLAQNGFRLLLFQQMLLSVLPTNSKNIFRIEQKRERKVQTSDAIEAFDFKRPGAQRAGRFKICTFSSQNKKKQGEAFFRPMYKRL